VACSSDVQFSLITFTRLLLHWTVFPDFSRP